VDEPWGDHLGDRWYVAPEDTLDSLVGALRSRGIQMPKSFNVMTSMTSACRTAMECGNPRRSNESCFTLCWSTPGTSAILDIYAELVEGQIGE